MFKKYEEPIVELIKFNSADIISTSSGDGFEDEVEVYGFPRCYKFFKLGKAKVRHTIEEGFVLEGHYRGEDYRISKRPIEANSLHLEYEWCYVKPYDCFDISIERDSLFCYPTKRDVITKLGFATEELYQMHLERVRKG